MITTITYSISWLPYLYTAYKLQENMSTAWTVMSYISYIRRIKRIYRWIFPKKIKEN